jgi:hypothetical protein
MQVSESAKIWASDWSDKYDQSWSEEKLRALVGKNVKALGPEVSEEDQAEGVKRKGFLNKKIVGYSIDTIPTDEADVHRFSVLTEDGLQVALIPEMEIEELELEEE